MRQIRYEWRKTDLTDEAAKYIEQRIAKHFQQVLTVRSQQGNDSLPLQEFCDHARKTMDEFTLSRMEYPASWNVLIGKRFTSAVSYELGGFVIFELLADIAGPKLVGTARSSKPRGHSADVASESLFLCHIFQSFEPFEPTDEGIIDIVTNKAPRPLAEISPPREPPRLESDADRKLHSLFMKGTLNRLESGEEWDPEADFNSTPANNVVKENSNMANLVAPKTSSRVSFSFPESEPTTPRSPGMGRSSTLSGTEARNGAQRPPGRKEPVPGCAVNSPTQVQPAIFKRSITNPKSSPAALARKLSLPNAARQPPATPARPSSSVSGANLRRTTTSPAVTKSATLPRGFKPVPSHKPANSHHSPPVKRAATLTTIGAKNLQQTSPARPGVGRGSQQTGGSGRGRGGGRGRGSARGRGRGRGGRGAGPITNPTLQRHSTPTRPTNSVVQTRSIEEPPQARGAQAAQAAQAARKPANHPHRKSMPSIGGQAGNPRGGGMVPTLCRTSTPPLAGHRQPAAAPPARTPTKVAPRPKAMSLTRSPGRPTPQSPVGRALLPGAGRQASGGPGALKSASLHRTPQRATNNGSRSSGGVGSARLSVGSNGTGSLRRQSVGSVSSADLSTPQGSPTAKHRASRQCVRIPHSPGKHTAGLPAITRTGSGRFHPIANAAQTGSDGRTNGAPSSPHVHRQGSLKHAGHPNQLSSPTPMSPKSPTPNIRRPFAPGPPTPFRPIPNAVPSSPRTDQMRRSRSLVGESPRPTALAIPPPLPPSTTDPDEESDTEDMQYEGEMARVGAPVYESEEEEEEEDLRIPVDMTDVHPQYTERFAIEEGVGKIDPYSLSRLLGMPFEQCLDALVEDLKTVDVLPFKIFVTQHCPSKLGTLFDSGSTSRANQMRRRTLDSMLSPQATSCPVSPLPALTNLDLIPTMYDPHSAQQVHTGRRSRGRMQRGELDLVMPGMPV